MPSFDAVEVSIRPGNAGPPAIVTMRILNADEQQLFTKSLKVEPTFDGFLHFDLSAAHVMVTPGQTYWIRMEEAWPTFFWRYDGDDPYPAGEARFGGRQLCCRGTDFRFKTYGHGTKSLGGLTKQIEMGQVAREGYQISAAQAASLEQSLARTPDDLAGRAKLLGFYFSPASESLGTEARIQARRRHILWLIDNHPDSALLAAPEVTLDCRGHALADPDGYEQARKTWIEQTAKSNSNAAVLGNAGRFFTFSDPALAAQFYARARTLEPDNAAWVALQGSVMAFAIVGITVINQNGLPGPADPAEADSDSARSIRRQLETTEDPALMRAAAGELMARGVIAQSLARSAMRESPPVDALGVAEHLLQRAEELEPGKPESSVALARIYQLRAMSATSEAEKKTLARARYEQLVKAVGGLPADDPTNAPRLLTLALASLDAGDLDRAQTLANQLLALVPKLKTDPRMSGSVDDIAHHSHLILGRAALRNGDIATAQANLLEAGRVEGGGTLSSFGPSMTLAKELLEAGDRETVVQYLELCRKFWRSGNRLDAWIATIRQGHAPNFGANLNY
jgi:hypothetical protein